MPDPTPPQAGRFRILVIEDDPHILRLIVATLTKASFECRTAGDGPEGLSQFEQFDPHLIVTDILMPGMDGRQVCTNIRKISMVPVIMMTAADTTEAQLAAFKAGADDYLAKPFDPRLLVSRVVAHLRRVYRYDAAIYAAPPPAPAQPSTPAQQPVPAQPSTPAQQSVPADTTDAYRVPWMTCATCGYMGPRDRFTQPGRAGQAVLRCPHCQESEHLRFAKFGAAG